MAEYIGREDLIRRLELSIKSWGRDCNSNAPVIVRTYQDVLHRVKNIPSADVAKVRHGRWLQTKEPLGYRDVDCVECSACHDSWVLEEEYDIEDYMMYWNYCPNCGAKMDGKGTHPTKIDK